MNSSLNSKEISATFADLKTDYLYIFAPFVILVITKIYTACWQDIILSPEWSLAACLMFGLITSKLSKAVSASKLTTSENHFGWYTAKRFALVILASTIYFLMLTKPSITLGIFQIALFIMASIFFFKDGIAAALFLKTTTRSPNNR